MRENFLISSRIFSQHFSVCSKHDISRFWTFFFCNCVSQILQFLTVQLNLNRLIAFQYFTVNPVRQTIPGANNELFNAARAFDWDWAFALFSVQLRLRYQVWVKTPFLICSNHFVHPIKNEASLTVGSCMRRRSSKSASLRRGPIHPFCRTSQPTRVLSDVEDTSAQIPIVNVCGPTNFLAVFDI